jgi:hypothetical protein
MGSGEVERVGRDEGVGGVGEIEEYLLTLSNLPIYLPHLPDLLINLPAGNHSISQ